MTLYDELIARGLIAQVTDEEQVRKLINDGKATFYIGFDPTADSLHVGHFMALCLMRRLQSNGNRPIALLGGGTAMVGDPSGKTDMRKMMTKEDIDHNAECFKKQMARFIDFSDGKALMVNNADWLLDLNYLEVLREIGPCFSVNNMLRAECYKQRMEKGLTFLPIEQIDEMDKWEGAQLNEAKDILAMELTTLVHGEEEAKKAREASRALFGGGAASVNVPSYQLQDADLKDGRIDILSVLVASGLCPSRSDARRNVQQGGVSVDGEAVKDIAASWAAEEFAGDGKLVKRGKKNFIKVIR